ncbi:fimbrial protein [Serratia fonticola]|uniref:fimbrial protein n=1 Tax=Serratia fonticola TaxID=47917 RepID=UPI00192CEC4C|nr:fimbrial protein [Serratia fonticola]MBL5825928.1 type 1 fimbrial protein [Serratia fonticola]
MNKLVVAGSVVAALAAINVANASDGTITFNGNLTANTCDVVVDGQTSNATIVLPTVSTKQLATAATTAGRTGFVMALKNCTGSLKTASAYFEAGVSVDPISGRLKNMTGTASNVALQLRDGTSSSMATIQAGNANQILNASYVDVSTGTANLPYAVEYYALGATTAGTVVSNVVYSIQYK